MAPTEGNSNQQKVGYNNYSMLRDQRKDYMLVILRLLSFCATLSATVVMALNKETKTVTVATIGTTAIKATLTAKFQDTPANIFFIVANGLATLHNLFMLVAEVLSQKMELKALSYTMVSSLDMMIVALLSAGACSAAYMAELAKNGNTHASWNKICDKFETFCHNGGGAILASFIGLALLMMVCLISNVRLQKQSRTDLNHQAAV